MLARGLELARCESEVAVEERQFGLLLALQRATDFGCASFQQKDKCNVINVIDSLDHFFVGKHLFFPSNFHYLFNNKILFPNSTRENR